MGTHPNAVLLLTLTPDDLPRKTWRYILQEAKVFEWENDGVIDEEGDIKIGDSDYHQMCMKSDYDEGMQISAKEGDIVLLDMVTYGYGDLIEWS